LSKILKYFGIIYSNIYSNQNQRRYTMQVAYRLNANELDMNFLESIKKLFQEKSIYINISIANQDDETDYLLSTPANASRLLNAINNIEKHKEKLIYKNLEDLG